MLLKNKIIIHNHDKITTSTLLSPMRKTHSLLFSWNPTKQNTFVAIIALFLLEYNKDNSIKLSGQTQMKRLAHLTICEKCIPFVCKFRH